MPERWVRTGPVPFPVRRPVGSTTGAGVGATGAAGSAATVVVAAPGSAKASVMPPAISVIMAAIPIWSAHPSVDDMTVAPACWISSGAPSRSSEPLSST